eukprot:gnl/TRDRNA2_/TRDRNA2_209167_c0_seq1.p1 gnl/TRDRNA2_/TRDRNA2_209167_c0~~gnl/TRDRNA2_/TRDRNA2_209167_c0_seq1.p1  ORF type:complete len:110 (-),score=5.77 gnl/TRDRNA2_/TRDRNA2_209167_c0_seq1:9-290(-)
MFAPLTKAGTIVVDCVVASNYASPSLRLSLPHGLAHNAMIPLRLWSLFGLSVLVAPVRSTLCHLFNWKKTCVAKDGFGVHPYAATLQQLVGWS